MPIKIKIEEVREYFAKENCILISKEYVTAKTKLKYIAQCGCIHYCNYNNFKNGKGRLCPRCKRKELSGKQAYSREDWIKRFKEVHGETYDYSKFNVRRSVDKGEIICPVHGSFFQRANDHQQGKGCSECSGKKIYTKEYFIKKAKKKYGDFYSYDKVNFVSKGKTRKILITCPIHGDFLKSPIKFLRGQGCTMCSNEKLSKLKAFTTDKFIEMSKKIYGNKYDYSKVNYKNSKTRVTIICPKHGEFTKVAGNFLNGQGCTECSNEAIRGENSHNWNPNITKEERLVRRLYPEYKDWIKSVFKKDDYTCQICLTKGGELNAHHLDGYHWCKERRIDVTNGVTLCTDCHNEFHKIYGLSNNTESQFIEYQSKKLNEPK